MIKNSKLTIKLGLIFSAFLLLVTIFFGFIIYRTQHVSNLEHCKQSAIQVTQYLKTVIEKDPENFITFQKYLISNGDDIEIDRSGGFDYIEAQREWERAFSSEYPGKVLYKDVQFENLNKELKELYVIYQYKYWRNVIIDSVKSFDIEYTYYITPSDIGKHKMYWIVDPLLDPRKGDEKHLDLCIDNPEPVSRFKVMWETWSTGRALDKYDVYKNKYGHVYSYYVPVYIHGTMSGMVGADVSYDSVQSNIVRGTARLLLAIFLILLAGVIVVMIIINAFYVQKVVYLNDKIEQYSSTKDSSISVEVMNRIKSNDEVDKLYKSFATMIVSIEGHVSMLIE